MLLSLLRSLRGASSHQAIRPRSRKKRPLRLEHLEARALLSRTIMVDDDRRQCPHADFTSIEAAVMAANPGDTIEVCPGQYNESVLVNKTLTIFAEQRGGDETARAGRAADPTRDAIVTPPAGLNGFNISANGVVLRGFTVQGTTGNAGIYTSPLFSGYTINDNLLRDNTFGLYFNSSGAKTSVVADNSFIDNNRPGAAGGNGLYSDQGLHNAVIDDNTFARNSNAAMILTAVGAGQLGNVTVAENSSTADGTLLRIDLSQGVTVTKNEATQSIGDSITVGGGNFGLAITNNKLHDGHYGGIFISDVFFAPPTNGPNTGLNISHNDIYGFRLSGIEVDPNSLVNSTISHNQIHNNGQDGIWLKDGDAGNHIVSNVLRNNARWDAHDDSKGTGTAGTANSWVHNVGKTSMPPGLLSSSEHGKGDQGDDGNGDGGDD